jgi:cellulose synthase operon protein YhjQ
VKTVAIIGAAGGAGVTTVAAHLAAGLAASARPVLAFDANPDNLMRLHLGMAWDDPRGFAQALAGGTDWHEAAYQSAGGVDFVPFGDLSSDAELSRLADYMTAHPHWLRSAMGTLALPADTIVVCDCPRLPSPFSAQVLAMADLVLVVMEADPVSYAVATRMVTRANGPGRAPALLLLNQFEPARALHRDISVLLRTAFRPTLSPVTIHRDAHVGEALGCKQTVFEFAPPSQAAHEFAALSTWVLARLGREAGN